MNLQRFLTLKNVFFTKSNKISLFRRSIKYELRQTPHHHLNIGKLHEYLPPPPHTHFSPVDKSHLKQPLLKINPLKNNVIILFVFYFTFFFLFQTEITCGPLCHSLITFKKLRSISKDYNFIKCILHHILVSNS